MNKKEDKIFLSIFYLRGGQYHMKVLGKLLPKKSKAPISQ